MTEPRPTTAAMRAAQVIQTARGNARLTWSCLELARLIDRETALPELLSLLWLAAEMLEVCDPPIKRPGEGPPKIVAEIRAALAKAGVK
jgi:hypothetical protein